MVESQISKIEVTQEDLSSVDSGGGYRVVNVEVVVDKTLPLYRQRSVVAHEILGAFLGSVVPTETLEEIAEEICSALEGLNEEIWR